jgi:predicted transcriptional regulator
VQSRIKKLEDNYGGSLEEIPELFANGGIDRKAFEDYVEWAGMEHSLRAYGEGEDFDYFTEDVVEISYDELARLTPKRIALMDQLSSFRAESINDLARRIGRDVKNVYNDLKILEDLKFVRLNREGRRLIPDLLVKEITFLTW